MKIGKALKVVRKTIERKTPDYEWDYIFKECEKKIKEAYKYRTLLKKEILKIACDECYRCFVDEVSFSPMGVDWSLYGYRENKEKEVEEDYYEDLESAWDRLLTGAYLQRLKENKI